MPSRPLRFYSFLAPNLAGVYRFITRHVSRKLGLATELVAGSHYSQLREADVAFVCGLAYVEFRDAPAGPDLEPIAAPVLRGERYRGRPVYFSDVIVRHDSPFGCFADLRGSTWSYNEPHSHSGFGITRYELARRGETAGYFGEVVHAGFHERSIRLVASRMVDASAVDSQVLATFLRDRPHFAARLRVLESWGPSTIQPVVASHRLRPELISDLRSVLLEMGDDPKTRAGLAPGLVDRFVAVDDSSYDDIRRMRDAGKAVRDLACPVRGAMACH